MPYATLDAVISLNTKPLEEGLEWSDNAMRNLTRSSYMAKLGLDTRTLKTDLASADSMLKAALKPLFLPIELSFKMVGDTAAIQKSEAVAAAMQKTIGELGHLQSAFDGLSTQALNTRFAELATAGNHVVRGLEAMNKEAGRTVKGLGEVEVSGGRVGKSFSSILDSAKNFIVGGAIVNGVSGAFRGLTGSIVDYESKIQTSRISLTAMFQGDQKAANDLLATIQKFVVKTPMELEDVLPLVPQLKAAKVATQEMLPTLTALGDVGAVSGKAIGEATSGMVRDLISLSARGKITAHDINNFGSYGVNIVTYLAQAYSDILPKGTKKAEQAMRDMIHKGLIPADQAIKAIVAGIEHDPLKAGQMEKMSHTYTTALSNIGDASKAVVGGGVAAQFNGLTEKLVQLGDVMMTPAFQSQAAAGIHLTVDALTALGQGVLWAAEVALDKLPYVAGVLGVIGSAKTISGIRTMGEELFASFGKASIPIAVATAAVIAFVAAYRNFGVVRDLTDVVVGGILEDFKGLSYGFQKIRGEIGAVVQGAGWVSGNADWVKWGKAQQGLETSTAKYWDSLIDGWTNTGSKKFKALLTSDFGKMLGIDGLSQSILDQMNKAASGFPTPAMPHLGADDTNATNSAAKEQKKALTELAKLEDKWAKSVEDNATRQLSALRKLNDATKGFFGNLQSELAKYGVFNSPLDAFINRIQKLLDIPNSAQSVVNMASKRIGELTEAAGKNRSDAATIGAATVPGGMESASSATRFLTTFKTREEMIWSQGFKLLAEESTRVQQLVKTQFGGNWDKMFAVMGNTSEETRQRLMRMAKPVTTQTGEQFAHPEQWSLKRMTALQNRFLIAAQADLGPRTQVPRFDGRTSSDNDPGLDPTYYNQLVQKRAGELANAYLRKIGELKDVTLTTVGGYPSNFDFGSVKRTQTPFTQKVTVPTLTGGPSTASDGSSVINNFLPGAAQAGVQAGSTLIKNLVQRFNDQSPRALGASCADVASRVLNQLGESLKYSANAGQLVKNARAAGWMTVPLGTPGSLNVQSGPGFGKVSGTHVTVGIGGGRVAGSSGYKFQEFDITGAKGHPYALAPAGAIGSHFLTGAARATGVGDAAALEGGENTVQTFKQRVQELLQGLRVDKLSLPKEWGAPLAEGANNAQRFAAQMFLANRETANLLRAKLGDKFAEFVKQLRETTNAADGYIERLKAAKSITDEIRALDTKSRARGHDNDPFFALAQRRLPGGDLASLVDLSAVQKKAVAAQATVLEAVVKVNTLSSKFAQGPTLATDKIDELSARAADLRRTISTATNFETLQAKTLKDALDSQTFTLNQNAKAVQDRRAALIAGSKFVTANTFDELGYARAVELSGKTTEYWAGEGVKSLKGHAEALEAFVKASALARFAQGPVAPSSALKTAKTQAEQIRQALATNLDKTLNQAGSAFDFEHAVSRGIDVAKMRQDMDRHIEQLSDVYRLASDNTLTIGQMNDQIEKSGFYFARYFQFKDAGHGARSDALATELAMWEQLGAKIERATEERKEYAKALDDTNRQGALGTTLRGLYATLPGGSGVLSRRVFEEQTKSDLMARFDKGDFDVPANTITAALRSMRGIQTAPTFTHDIGEVTKRLNLALQGYDDKGATDRAMEQGNKLAQMRLDLTEKMQAAERPLSEYAKTRADWLKIENDLKSQGLKLTSDDLKIMGQQLGVARQIDATAVQAWQKQMSQNLTIAGTMDPKKRADLQFRLDHADWDKATLDALSPLNAAYIKAQADFDKIKTLQDDVQSSWNSMFTNIRTQGLKSIDSLFDGITNAVFKFGADFLASQTSGLVDKFIGAITGSIFHTKTPLYTPYLGAVGDAPGTFIPSPTIPSIGATGVATNALSLSALHSSFMLQAAHDLTVGAARQAAMQSGGGNSGNIYIEHAHFPEATNETQLNKSARSLAKNTTGPRNARRTDAKIARRFIGGGQ